jgi:hypothetical protein
MKDARIMIGSPKTLVGIVAFALMAGSVVQAEKWDPDTITEKDKQTYRDFVAGMKKEIEVKKDQARQVTAINNLRQIGIALLEFETEYGEYPNEDTAGAVKEATETEADLKAATSNDCFFQLIAAGIVQTDRIFTFTGGVEQVEKEGVALEQCDFALLMVKTAVGNPNKPLVVSPLLNGKETFDPVALGGRAVVLHLDCSVRSYPIDKDGRVMINGMDLFDPKQPFWNGEVPEIRWPKG